MTEIQYQRILKVRKEYDVLVAGAGPAGICAAVAAAREGVTVALIERYGGRKPYSRICWADSRYRRKWDDAGRIGSVIRSAGERHAWLERQKA